jgi:hypothetical protein
VNVLIVLAAIACGAAILYMLAELFFPEKF